MLTLADNPRHCRAKLVRITARGRETYEAVMSVWTPHSIKLGRNVGLGAAHSLLRGVTDLAGDFRTIARHGAHSSASTPLSQEEPQP